MNLSGTRFGTIEFLDTDVITFIDGIIGFPAYQRFVLIDTGANESFRWLQSLDEPALAFLLADPVAFVPTYAPEITDREAQSLALTAETPQFLYVTANIPAGKPHEMTVNLAAPIIINALNRLGKQVVLEDQAYTIRHKVFEQKEAAPLAA